jgi:hypothetical protein
VAHLLALGALAGAVACHNPAAPSPAPPVPYSITISGTLSLHQPGDTGQLTAIATLTGGTTKDVTAEAVWTTTGSALSVSRAGLVTALSYGSGEVVAVYGMARQPISARVAPDGAFLITGKVTSPAQPVQANVEATSALGAFSTVADTSGTFVVPAAGATTLQVSAIGFDTAVRQVTVNQDDQVTVELQQSARPPVQPWSFSGRYSLTFVASPSCTLPAWGKQRTYGADVEGAQVSGASWALDVTLNGADLVFGWGGEAGFSGTMDGNIVRFVINDDLLGDYYTFIERIGGLYMHYSGTATGTVSNGSILTTFNGRVVLSTTGVGGTTVAECIAPNHRLEFVR